MKKYLLMFLWGTIVAAILAGTSGCESMAFQIKDQVDPITGERSVVSVNNSMDAGFTRVDLNMVIIHKGTEKEKSLLALYYMGSEWLFVSEQNEIIFNVDGIVLKVRAIAPGSIGQRETISGAGGVKVIEKSFYIFDKDVISRVASGKVVKGRVQGTKSFVDFDVTDVNKANLRAMLAASSSAER